MRAYKNAIILLVVALLLGGGFFAYYKFVKKDDVSNNTTNSPTTPVKTEQEVSILKLDKTKIKTIEILSKGEKYLFTKNGENLTLQSPKIPRLDQNAVTQVESTLGDLISKDLMDKDAKDIEQYGLKNPQATAVVKFTDSTTKTLYIGDMTPAQDAYYCKTADSNAVYTILVLHAENLMVNKMSLADRSVYKAAPEDVNYIALWKNGKLSFKATMKEAQVWKIEEPFEAEGDSEKIKPMIDNAIKFNIKDYLGSNLNLADYGLDKPSYAFEMGDKKNGRTKILIGKQKVRGSEVYAKFENSPEILVLYETEFDFGDKTVVDIMNRFIHYVKIDDVSDIEVTASGEKTLVKLETGKADDNSDDKFYIENVQLKTDSELRTFYASMIGLMANDVQAETKPSGGADITIILHQKKAPSEVKIELIKKDDNNYYAVKNAKFVGLIVKKENVDSFLKDLKTVKDLSKTK